jgi:hypothetical protein
MPDGLTGTLGRFLGELDDNGISYLGTNRDLSSSNGDLPPDANTAQMPGQPPDAAR